MECCPTPLQWLCKIAARQPVSSRSARQPDLPDNQELEHAVVCVNPEHPKHAQWVTCLVSMQAMEELGNFQLPAIVYRSLRHGAMHYHAET
jgi:hypothetical protein